jgi:hypothetical protein
MSCGSSCAGPLAVLAPPRKRAPAPEASYVFAAEPPTTFLDPAELLSKLGGTSSCASLVDAEGGHGQGTPMQVVKPPRIVAQNTHAQLIS